MKQAARSLALNCPCGTNRPLAACCGRFHAGEAAPDPEALMRSRYSAFAGRLADYLLATWHPRTRPAELTLDDEPPPKWLGLSIRRAESDGDTGLVEFVARHRVGGRAYRLHETSRFERVDGRWYYVDGEIHSG